MDDEWPNAPSAAWWKRAEQATPSNPASPTWLVALETAHQAELLFRIDDAQLALAKAEHAPTVWQPVRELLALRIAARAAANEGVQSALRRVREILAGPLDPASRGRVQLLRGTLCLRSNLLSEAESALVAAIPLLQDAPAGTWALDSFATVLTGQGALEEARRLLRSVIERKATLADALGVAISAGNLARLELRGGSARDALSIVVDTLSRWGTQLEPLALLRLETARLEAALLVDEAEQGEAASAVQARLERLRGVTHYLAGFAELTLARARQGQERERALQRARSHFSLPVHVALFTVWHEEQSGNPRDVDGWLERVRPLLDAAGPGTEAELRAHLLVARRGQALGDSQRCGLALQAAERCARLANNALWMSQVDEQWFELEGPAAHVRVLARFSGASVRELQETRREAAAIVFADLVGFTSRSDSMQPEQVMSTVRGLFEALAPVLMEFRVRPLAYLGDGLLAVAQGEGHQQRAVQCAVELVRRAQRLSVARRAAGEAWGLDLRAGVAGGPVVLGPLGNQLKFDFTAIGMPVNLAARLQGASKPGQVTVELEMARAAGYAIDDVEALSLKGVAQATQVVRISPDAAEPES